MQRPTTMGHVTGASALVAAPTIMPFDMLPNNSTVSSRTASMKNHPIPPSVFELMRVVRGLVMLVAAPSVAPIPAPPATNSMYLSHILLDCTCLANCMQRCMVLVDSWLFGWIVGKLVDSWLFGWTVG